MGQSWVDGFLPYTALWDLKPSTTFLFFASLICAFGKSFLAIRIAGVFLVAITSTLTYKIGISIANKKVAFWSGLLIVILATAIPYYLNNDFQLWWQSVFKAPIAYSSSKEHSILNVLPFAVLIFGFFLWGIKKQFLDYKKPEVLLLIITSVGIVFSFMQAGKVNGHYLIQLYPTLVLLVSLTFYKLGFIKTLKYKPIVLFLLLLIPIESYLELKNVIQHKMNKGSFYNGEGITVPDYFRDHDLSTDKILFMEYHIGYWLLNEQPPTKAATHPSSILREELFPYMKNSRKSESDELQFILEHFKPNYIVTRKNRRVFDKKKIAANFYINLQLLKNYSPLDTVDNAVIYKRLKFK